jgi:hypothetical protein
MAMYFFSCVEHFNSVVSQLDKCTGSFEGYQCVRHPILLSGPELLGLRGTQSQHIRCGESTRNCTLRRCRLPIRRSVFLQHGHNLRQIGCPHSKVSTRNAFLTSQSPHGTFSMPTSIIKHIGITATLVAVLGWNLGRRTRCNSSRLILAGLIP